MKYYYTREESIDGVWNINYPTRIDALNNRVILAKEIQNAFPVKSFLFFAGYKDYTIYLQDGTFIADPNNQEIPYIFGCKEDAEQYIIDNNLENTTIVETENTNKVVVDFKDYTLTGEEKDLLDIIVDDHKNNVPDMWAVWYQDSFIQDPGNPGNAYLFNTEEQAQQFIITDNLDGAVVKGVVVL